MTVLSKSFRISNYNTVSNSGLTNQFFIVTDLMRVVDNQSTIFKENGSLTLANKIEIQKIKSFSELEKNWDSYDAQEINDNVIKRAVNIVEELNSLDEDVYFTSPGPNGEIMILLKKDAKEAELIVYEEMIKYVTFSDNQFEKQGNFTSELLPEIVEWLNI